MKFGTDITIDANLLDRSQEGKILEIKFIGFHNHPWPHPEEICDYLETVVDQHKPDAILLNYSEYRYSFGNELMATILIPVMNLKKNSMRPCAVIAEGPTKDSLQRVIDESMIQKLCSIVLIKDKTKAMEHLKKKLRTA